MIFRLYPFFFIWNSALSFSLYKWKSYRLYVFVCILISILCLLYIDMVVRRMLNTWNRMFQSKTIWRLFVSFIFMNGYQCLFGDRYSVIINHVWLILIDRDSFIWVSRKFFKDCLLSFCLFNSWIILDRGSYYGEAC